MPGYGPCPPAGRSPASATSTATAATTSSGATATARFTTWLGQANGGFVSNDANASPASRPTGTSAATGDFNGDGRDDIAVAQRRRPFTDWLGQANGSFASNAPTPGRCFRPTGTVDGTGDFNGDGRDDILWRNDDGAFTNWLGQANGSFVSNDANASPRSPTSWQVAETGDYNGDGRDDILWRNSNGSFTNWLAQANGSFVSNDVQCARRHSNGLARPGTGYFLGVADPA